MKSFSLAFTLILLFGFFISCNNDDQINKETRPHCIVKKMYRGDTVVRTFNYDDKWRLTSVNFRYYNQYTDTWENSETKYTYNEKFQVIKHEVFGSYDKMEVYFFYNSKGLLEKSLWTGFQQILYYYDSQDRLIQTEYSLWYDQKELYYYTDNNITKREIYFKYEGSWGLHNTEYYKYDNRPNYLKHFKGIYPYDFQAYNENNIVSVDSARYIPTPTMVTQYDSLGNPFETYNKSVYEYLVLDCVE